MHRVEAELKILQAEYQTAWESVRERFADAQTVNTEGPPIFVNGINIGRVDTSPGEWLELDFRAIHPSHQPFYYFPDEFIIDATRFGDSLSINPQSGLFRWVVPEYASGEYVFNITAEVNGNQTATLPFTVRVTESAKPSIQSLRVSPTTVTDTASDPVTLTAIGASHPSGQVDRVYFYQDANGNGTLEEDVDFWLGRDEIGEDGWSWSGLPRRAVDATAKTQAFFAVAFYSTFSATRASSPASVVANVIQTPVDVDIATPIDTSDVIIETFFNASSLPPVPVVDEAGNVVTVDQKSGGGDVFIRTNDEPPRKIATGQLVSAFAMNAHGEGIVAWRDYWATDGHDVPIFLQSFSQAGRQLGPVVSVTVTAGSVSDGSGGGWKAVDINDEGDFVLAWSGQGIWGSIGSLEKLAIVETEYTWPGNVAINESGWSLFTDFRGSKGQVFDPAGQKIGREFTVRDHSKERKVARYRDAARLLAGARDAQSILEAFVLARVASVRTSGPGVNGT